MNIETLLYAIFCIFILIILLNIVIRIISDPSYSTKFYNYKIKYDTDLDKYYSMLKKQKKVILKKEIQLLYLKLLVILKCW